MTSQQIDAEALYQSLVAQLRTRLADGHTWSVAGIVSGGAWIAKRLAHDLGLPEYGVVNVAMTTPRKACTPRRSRPRCRSM